MKKTKIVKKHEKDLVLVFIKVIMIVMFFYLIIGLLENLYIEPIVKDNANEFCQDKGYDFYEDYARTGLINSNPIAVRCKYAENSREIDLTQTYGGFNLE